MNLNLIKCKSVPVRALLPTRATIVEAMQRQDRQRINHSQVKVVIKCPISKGIIQSAKVKPTPIIRETKQ